MVDPSVITLLPVLPQGPNHHPFTPPILEQDNPSDSRRSVDLLDQQCIIRYPSNLDDDPLVQGHLVRPGKSLLGCP